MCGIHISKAAALQCRFAVAASIKELTNTAESMKANLIHLENICQGEQFNAIKQEVTKEINALLVQIEMLRGQTLHKLDEIIAWYDSAKRKF